MNKNTINWINKNLITIIMTLLLVACMVMTAILSPGWGWCWYLLGIYFIIKW